MKGLIIVTDLKTPSGKNENKIGKYGPLNMPALKQYALEARP
jgi:hypothetical protein